MDKDIVFSFDIFDTCITRRCGKPDNVFYLLAKDVMQDRSTTFVLDFIRERKLAEKEALERHPEKQDVNIDEIYECFDVSLFTSTPKEFVKNKEIEIELNSFAPIKQTMDLIDDCRQMGRIIFISDMYLPYDVLYKKLKELNVIQGNEPFYLSNKIGKTKRHGDLFDYVKEKENINIKHWTHFGDNSHADYKIPKSKGLKAEIITYPYSTHENIWEAESKYLQNLDLSVFCGIFHSLRLQNTKGILNDFAHNIMTPLVIGFVLNLFRCANLKGTKRLYFVSRDMYVFYVAAQILSPLFPGIELRYLYLSTKTIYPTLIKEGTLEELHKILDLVYFYRPIIYLKMFGFSNDEIRFIQDKVDIHSNISINDEKADMFIQVLLSDKINKILVKHCANKRTLLIEYLRQEKLFENENAAIVDLGWRTTSQMALKKCLPENVHYFYLGVSNDRLSVFDVGKREAMCHGDNLNTLFFHREFIEYYICRTKEGSTIGYEKNNLGDILPIKEKTTLLPDEIIDIEQNLNWIKKAAKEFLNYSQITQSSEQIFYNCIIKSLCYFVQHPSKDILNPIVPYLKFSHYGEERQIIIHITPLMMLKTILNKVARTLHFHELYKMPVFWRKASFVYTYGDRRDKFLNFLGKSKNVMV